MIIKKYRANTVEEARNLVVQELGPEAIILTTNYIKENGLKALFSITKVEITAAVEESELKAHQALQKISPLQIHTDAHPEPMDKSIASVHENKEAKKEVSMDLLSLSPAAKQKQKELQDQLLSVDTHIEPELPSTKIEEISQEKSHAVEDALLKLSKNLVHQFGHLTKVENHNHDTKPAEKQTKPLKDLSFSSVSDLAIIREIVREEISHAYHSVIPEEYCSPTMHFLLSKGLKRSLAQLIEQKITRECKVDSRNSSIYERTKQVNMIKNELAQLICTTGALTLHSGAPSIVAIVGPTGVGKTTTWNKIAWHYTQKERRVGMIGIKGSVVHESLKEKVLQNLVALESIHHPDELPLAIKNLQKSDVILIDTPGAQQYEWHFMQKIMQKLQASENVQIHLALSATTKDVDAYGIVQQFHAAPLTGVIFTKLDETINYGILMNVCYTKQKPISYLTTGTNITSGLVLADAQGIARRFLVTHNEYELQQLRDIAIN